MVYTKMEWSTDVLIQTNNYCNYAFKFLTLLKLKRKMIDNYRIGMRMDNHRIGMWLDNQRIGMWMNVDG